MTDLNSGSGDAAALHNSLNAAERKIEELVNLATLSIDAIGASDIDTTNDELQKQLREDLHDIVRRDGE